MSRRTTHIFFYAMLICVFNEGWAAQAADEVPRQLQPEEIVKRICVIRVEQMNWQRIWDLMSIKDYFSSDLQRDIANYTDEERRFFAKYGKYSNNMAQLGLYIDLTQGDPITGVHDAPKSVSTHLIKNEKASREYKISYQMYGTSKGAPQFNQNVHLRLDMIGSKWVIVERWFDEPMGSFDPTVHLWTLGELLKRLTQELRDSAACAELHPKELIPNNEDIHVGRGPFDKP